MTTNFNIKICQVSLKKFEDEVKNNVFRDDYKRIIKEAIKILTPDQKKIIKAKFFRGLTHREISERYGMSMTKVARIKKEALEILGRNKNLRSFKMEVWD